VLNLKIHTIGVVVVPVADKSISNTRRSGAAGRQHLRPLDSQQTALPPAAAVAVTSFVT